MMKPKIVSYSIGTDCLIEHALALSKAVFGPTVMGIAISRSARTVYNEEKQLEEEVVWSVSLDDSTQPAPRATQGSTLHLALIAFVENVSDIAARNMATASAAVSALHQHRTLHDESEKFQEDWARVW